MANKLTTDTFIAKAISVHGDKYDYKLVNYINSNTKVTIICNKCGNIFKQEPNHHLCGSGCPVEGGSLKLTTNTFIKKAQAVHKNNYDYSLVQYINAKTKVKIICNMCGHIFEQSPSMHLSGRGCPVEGGSLKLDTDTFIKKACAVHGQAYDYSIVDYVNINTKVQIICNTCGNIFKQRPNAHLSGQGCPIENGNLVLTDKIFIQRAKTVHGNIYDYTHVVYTNIDTKVNIGCTICQKLFEQTPANHLNGHGCPYHQKSKGEQLLFNWLILHNIKFEQQYTFEDCRGVRKKLKFDFAILDEQLKLIEYQGRQHYTSVEYFASKNYGLAYIQKNDQIKRDYCKQNNIPLLEIPYWYSEDAVVSAVTEFVS